MGTGITVSVCNTCMNIYIYMTYLYHHEGWGREGLGTDLTQTGTILFIYLSIYLFVYLFYLCICLFVCLSILFIHLFIFNLFYRFYFLRCMILNERTLPLGLVSNFM